ncbi:hypothetical protein [Thiohalorhabdus methylotrophus]|uniref:ATP-binding protein n=1 Tax=Thiohalorhabdus methylotrophus TaxID=3242694 RepID=A0ABV4TSH5_9GAMM
MPPNQDSLWPSDNPEGREAFLRSINLPYDADAPERIAHFYPTSKCVSLLRAVLGQEADRAYFVIAPYGSGKSLTAAYALHLIENRKEARPVLNNISARLADVDGGLGEFAQARSEDQAGGLVLALHGYCPSLPEALKEAALAAMRRVKLGREARKLEKEQVGTMDEAVAILRWLQEEGVEKGYDRIAILWDEFGRHVDSLVAEGKAADLVDIQVLAEYAARTQDPPVTLGLFLHQGLLHYASEIPQGVRKEWTKIEGRFQSIQYLDDSKEIYRLIAQIATEQRPFDTPPESDFPEAARKLQELGRFKEFSQGELAALLADAYPLEPLTLELLPRVAGRVAQNERTLFGFLYQTRLDGPITPADLYDYFSEAMRADTGVGGTYRQWLETESALAKVGDSDLTRDALKTTCLLGLGASGERARANHPLLVTAVGGYRNEELEAEEAINALIEQKLLLHRRHSDSVSVWHGTDADLRGKLEEEKAAKRAQFDLRAFLEEELPAPAWRPVEYNDDYRIRRYFTGEFHTLDTITPYLDTEAHPVALPLDTDGKVLYLLVESPKELSEAEQLLKGQETNSRLVFAFPSEALPLTEAALEVWCLTHMQHDSELVGADPLILPELRQMADDARAHLKRMAHRLLYPGAEGPTWYHRGREVAIGNAKKLRKTLSGIMRETYPDTPRINNELIVRKKPSRIIINARKKLVLGILERAGTEDLGLQGKTPDVSMYRTVLAQTGLYGPDGETNRFARADELQDPGLTKVWQEFEAFFTEPEDYPKAFEDLFTRLKQPPYGVRNGLFPVFLAAAFKAFPNAISLLRDGVYVEDILPSEVETIFRSPERYRLQVLGIDEAKTQYLLGFYEIFTGEDLAEEDRVDDLIRTCFEAFQAWKLDLPVAAYYSSQLSKEARAFQKAIQAELDPVRLLFSEIPKILGVSEETPNEALAGLRDVKEELESVHLYLGKMAGESMRKVIAPGKETDLPLSVVANEWANAFPKFVVDEIKDASVKALITQMARSYKSDELLLNALSQGLLGKPLKRWDDSTRHTFERDFERAARKAEDAALSAVGQVDPNTEGADALAGLVEDRVSTLVDRLTRLLGPEETERFLRNQVRKSEPENGDS